MNDARAVRAMVTALREDSAPEPDWDGLEQRLSARLDDAERVSRLHAPRVAVSPLRTALPMLAAAAAIVLAVGVGGSGPAAPVASATRFVAPSSVPLAAGEAGQRGAHDLAALRVGDVIEAGDGPATFLRSGSVEWTLAPGGRVVVKAAARAPAVGDADGGHVVALERGSLRAEVVPRDPALGLVEAFAVEVGGTRVAVHGTAFSVTRAGDGVVVDVEHGAVAVGPVGHVGETSGHLLVGPSRASFSLDGGRRARRLPREEAIALAPAPAPMVASAAPLGATGDAPAATAAMPAPARAVAALRASSAADASSDAAPRAPADVASGTPEAPAPASLTVDGVRAGLERCLARAYDGAGSTVALSVSSTLTVTLRDDGTVLSARFDPPLKPEFQACAGGALGGRFGDGPRTRHVPVTFSR